MTWIDLFAADHDIRYAEAELLESFVQRVAFTCHCPVCEVWQHRTSAACHQIHFVRQYDLHHGVVAPRIFYISTAYRWLTRMS